MEFAEGGTIRSYLEKNFSSLEWQDKYKLALQLSSAIEYLHDNGIVHNDLHSNNILIQQNSIKLADSGLNKRIRGTIQLSLNSFDMIPYIDPQGIVETLSGGDKQIEKLKKGDIYSIGMLFWELSSGKKPFSDKEYDLSLAMGIAQGLREKVVDSTPKGYSDLYASRLVQLVYSVMESRINLLVMI